MPGPLPQLTAVTGMYTYASSWGGIQSHTFFDISVIEPWLRNILFQRQYFCRIPCQTCDYEKLDSIGWDLLFYGEWGNIYLTSVDTQHIIQSLCMPTFSWGRFFKLKYKFKSTTPYSPPLPCSGSSPPPFPPHTTWTYRSNRHNYGQKLCMYCTCTYSYVDKTKQLNTSVNFMVQ